MEKIKDSNPQNISLWMVKLVLTETAVARGQRAVLPLGYERVLETR